MSESRVCMPPCFQERVLAREGRGVCADTLLISVPLTTVPGEPFTVHVSALSGGCEPTVHCDGRCELACESGGVSPISVFFEEGRPATAYVSGVRLCGEGMYRFRGRLNGREYWSNPTRCLAGASYRIAWGDPHVHTVLSNCHAARCRSLNFAFSAGRYVSGLQWMSAADHVSNGRCSRGQFREESETSDNYDDPPEFVTLPAYEASLKGGCGGDNNIYMRRWPADFVDHYEDGNVKTLLAELDGLLDPDASYAVPHHTSRAGKHGEIPWAIYPGAARMPVAEITSCWGNSEYRGNPDPLEKVHAGPSYVVDLLNQGLPLGFIGGTDTHVSNPFQLAYSPPAREHLLSDPGGTGVFVERLDRGAIFDAIRARNCYAGKRERTYLEVFVNDLRGGAIAEGAASRGPRTVRFTAAGASDIVSVEIVRNGEPFACVPGSGWHMAGEVRDEEALEKIALTGRPLERFAYYYVRVRYASGAMAWSSPVWFVLG